MDEYIMTNYKEKGDAWRNIMALNRKIAELEKQIADARELMSIQFLRMAYLDESIANHGERENIVDRRKNTVRPVETYRQPQTMYQTPSQVPVAIQQSVVPQPVPYTAQNMPVQPQTRPIQYQAVPQVTNVPVGPQTAVPGAQTSPVVSTTSGKSNIEPELRRVIIGMIRKLYTLNRTTEVQQILDSYNIANVDEATPDIAQMLYQNLSSLINANASR